MNDSIARPLDVVIAGAAGWAGSALARGIARQQDMRLAGAIGQRTAGRQLGDVLGDPQIDCVVFASIAEALARAPGCDVYVEYSKPKDTAQIKANVLAALAASRSATSRRRVE